MAMSRKLCFILILSMCLLIVEFSRAQEEESPSPAISPEREPLAVSPLPPPSSSPESDSPLPPPASSPEPESVADSPSPPPPPPPPRPESPSPSPSSSSAPSPGPAPVPAPSDDDSDDDSDPETEYFPSPAPSPAPEVGEPADIKASEDGDEEFEDEDGRGEDNGTSGLKKAGIAIGAILGVGAIVIGALVYKKRRDNLTRARYTYFNQGEFL